MCFVVTTTTNHFRLHHHHHRHQTNFFLRVAKSFNQASDDVTLAIFFWGGKRSVAGLLSACPVTVRRFNKGVALRRIRFVEVEPATSGVIRGSGGSSKKSFLSKYFARKRAPCPAIRLPCGSFYKNKIEKFGAREDRKSRSRKNENVLVPQRGVHAHQQSVYLRKKYAFCSTHPNTPRLVQGVVLLKRTKKSSNNGSRDKYACQQKY